MVDDHVAAGRAMQRFWLTATKLGLQLQPELTPLIFSGYVRAGRSFSEVAEAGPQAIRLAGQLVDLIGARDASHAVFMGRIGDGNAATARSLRLSLDRLRRAEDA
jgi:hypothetical protein